ncbi:UDP-Glycosyltransferase/glycogen phosphorylase [Meredithblackwellia eburnea MCA 4105]
MQNRQQNKHNSSSLKRSFSSGAGSARPLRIAFIHPDLGLGGAERLVVDAAVGLQARGNTVDIFTSHHEDGERGRSFEETRNGTLKVHVLGGHFIPRSFLGRFSIVCAILRQFHLTVSFLLASFLFRLGSLPIFSSILLPLDHPFFSSSDWSFRRQLAPYDVIIIDQLSASIPLLRWFGGNRVVFYCHFPDLLLSPTRSAHEGEDPSYSRPPLTPAVILRSIYRAPIDFFEETTTGEADKILVNSEFTQRMFQRTFKSLGRIPRVVYPGINLNAQDDLDTSSAKGDKWLVSDSPTLLSINRFEGKKKVTLALEAFARSAAKHPNLRLVLAGGYDPRLADNVETLHTLQTLATSLGLTHFTYCSSELPSTSSTVSIIPEVSQTPPSSTPQVLLLLNVSAAHKAVLLTSPSTEALLYTPAFEHFGIVPLEAMSSGLPVLATTSGGPVETVVDAGLTDPTTTGLLRPQDPELWSQALNELLDLAPDRRREIGAQGRARVRDKFSVAKLAEEMERVSREAAALEAPIWQETGLLKLVAFLTIGFFVLVSGVLAFALPYYT